MANLGTPKYVTIHCSATPEGREISAETISKWDIERFNQVSYHYVIEIDGTVKNTLPLDRLGAHVGGHNSNNIGICYVGGLDADGNPKDTRTDAQKSAMVGLLDELHGKFGALQVLGHKDWPNVQKACPCFDVKSWLQGLASTPLKTDMVVNTPNDTLNVRTHPDSMTVLGELADKTPVKIIDSLDGWFFIKTDSLSGWANGNYLN